MSARLLRLGRAALEGAASRRLRALLALAGVAVGVGAVVLMVAISLGARNQVLAQVTALGSDLIFIRAAKATPTGAIASSRREKLSLTQADAAELGRLGGVARAVPMVSRNLRVSSQGAAVDCLVLAVPLDLFDLEGHQAVEGRFFSEEDDQRARRVALVGPSVRQALAGQGSLLGQTLEIKKQPFTVIGELAAKGLDPRGMDLDDRVYIPLRTGLRRLLGNQRYVEFIIAQAEPGLDLDEVSQEMGKLLRQRHRLFSPEQRDDFTINTQLEMLAAQEESSRLFGALTVGVAGLSLLVAGVGVMAVQLIGVRERAREIGVRRAVGARRRDILGQFLLEACWLGLGGGLAGALAGLGLAAAVRSHQEMVFDLPWDAAGLALLISLAVAVFFGLWPARQAARLTPVEAVRRP